MDMMGVDFSQRETILWSITMSANLLSPLFSFEGEMRLGAAMSHYKGSRGFLCLVFMP